MSGASRERAWRTLPPAGRSIRAWAPAANEAVRALILVGATVYVGGDFTAIDGQPRSRLAALDGVNGQLRAGTPQVDGFVHVLAAANGVIYVGGKFARIGGADRQDLAAFGAADGALTAWDPRVQGPEGPTGVEALLVEGGTLYAGGSFTTVGGQPRRGLAAFDLATGALTAWDPQADYQTPGDSTGPGTEVDALVAAGDTVYVGGIFNRIGAAARASLAAVDARTGQALPWVADVEGFVVSNLALVGDRLYVGGGQFDTIARERPTLASVSATTGQWLTWDPRPNGPSQPAREASPSAATSTAWAASARSRSAPSISAPSRHCPSARHREASAAIT